MTAQRLETLEKMFEQKPESLVFSRLADEYRKKGEIEKAIEICHEGLKHSPDYTTGHLILGRCYLERDEMQAATQSFLEVLRFDSQNMMALKMLADIVGRTGDTETSDQISSYLHQLDPLNERYASSADAAVALSIDELLSSLAAQEPQSEKTSLQQQITPPVFDEPEEHQPLQQEKQPPNDSFESVEQVQTLEDVEAFSGQDTSPQQQVPDNSSQDQQELVLGEDVSRRIESLFEGKTESDQDSAPETGAVESEEEKIALPFKAKSERIESIFTEAEQSETDSEQSSELKSSEQATVDNVDTTTDQENQPEHATGIAGSDITNRLNEMFGDTEDSFQSENKPPIDQNEPQQTEQHFDEYVLGNDQLDQFADELPQYQEQNEPQDTETAGETGSDDFYTVSSATASGPKDGELGIDVYEDIDKPNQEQEAEAAPFEDHQLSDEKEDNQDDGQSSEGKSDEEQSVITDDALHAELETVELVEPEEPESQQDSPFESKQQTDPAGEDASEEIDQDLAEEENFEIAPAAGVQNVQNQDGLSRPDFEEDTINLQADDQISEEPESDSEAHMVLEDADSEETFFVDEDDFEIPDDTDEPIQKQSEFYSLSGQSADTKPGSDESQMLQDLEEDEPEISEQSSALDSDPPSPTDEPRDTFADSPETPADAPEAKDPFEGLDLLSTEPAESQVPAEDDVEPTTSESVEEDEAGETADQSSAESQAQEPQTRTTDDEAVRYDNTSAQSEAASHGQDPLENQEKKESRKSKLPEDFVVEQNPLSGQPVFSEADENEAAPPLSSAVVAPVSQKPSSFHNFSIPDHVITPTLADIYAQQGQLELAIEIYSRLLAKNPDNDRIEDKKKELEKRLAETRELEPNSEDQEDKQSTKASSRKKKSKPLSGVKIKPKYRARAKRKTTRKKSSD